MNEVKVPTYVEMAWPTLQAIEGRGGSATVRELSEDVAKLMDLSEEVLEILHRDGPRTKFQCQAGWALSYLGKMGALENSSRGVWSLTNDGRQLDAETDFKGQFREIAREASQRSRSKAATPESPSAGDQQDDLPVDPEDDPAGEDAWQGILLAVLQSLSGPAFEWLCQRVLREHGFGDVKVTKRSGDGGIDGVGVLPVGLLSFRVVFQCKRWQGTVGAPEIQKFQGAMMGQAEKGLFLTTGRFSSKAKEAAVSPGAPAVDLIDGLELCQLLKERDLGVKTEKVTDERVSVDSAFFKQFERA